MGGSSGKMGAVRHPAFHPLMGKGGPGASSWFCHSAHSTASLSFQLSAHPDSLGWGKEATPRIPSILLYGLLWTG